jgi:hypothetical protein
VWKQQLRSSEEEISFFKIFDRPKTKQKNGHDREFKDELAWLPQINPVTFIDINHFLFLLTEQYF